MDFKHTLTAFLRLISFTYLVVFASNALANNMSGWSDKTICRLIGEEHPYAQHTKYLQEAKRRELICNNGNIAGYENTNNKAKNISICDSKNLKDCTEQQICSRATYFNSARHTRFWGTSGIAKIYKNEAQSREYNCSVSINKKIKTCSSDPAICTDIILCRWATTSNNGQIIWKSEAKYDSYITEAEKRKLSCKVNEPIKKTTKPKVKAKLGSSNSSQQESKPVDSTPKQSGNNNYETINFTNDSFYYGEVSNSMPHGLGTLYQKNKVLFNGKWLNGTSENQEFSVAHRKSSNKVAKAANKPPVELKDKNTSNPIANATGSTNSKSKGSEPCSSNALNCPTTELCERATHYNGENKVWWGSNTKYGPYVTEAKNRKLTCGISMSSANKTPQLQPPPKPSNKQVNTKSYTSNHPIITQPTKYNSNTDRLWGPIILTLVITGLFIFIIISASNRRHTAFLQQQHKESSRPQSNTRPKYSPDSGQNQDSEKNKPLGKVGQKTSSKQDSNADRKSAQKSDSSNSSNSHTTTQTAQTKSNDAPKSETNTEQPPPHNEKPIPVNENQDNDENPIDKWLL